MEGHKTRDGSEITLRCGFSENAKKMHSKLDEHFLANEHPQ